ncbi:hypothetical protein CCAX7_18450 [Capsulimonas corticalis]|uniref:Uncharacterized protein n=1 Tax=Capsulimonas corticalis TaxID=2219043 RepID=A0A402D5P4_9BACT|nr:hypothetical protein [Capsulimonas corticalis]BDI29794.1 hypothetical protein CCAX7_18450 [Capsulimonas corticalis]
MKLPYLVFIAFFGFCSAPAPAAPVAGAPQYQLTDLGVTPFIADNTSLSIDADGSVGLWRADAEGAAQAALWRNGATALFLRNPGYRSSVSRSLSAGGTLVVGWTSTSGNSVDSLATTRAFFARGGKPVVLGTLGGRDSQAFGVNAKGLIVGAAQTKARERHAFVLSSGGVMRDLGLLPAGRSSAAYAVNAAGAIVGAADAPLAGAKIFMNHAVLWRGGKMTDLGLLPEGQWAYATAINSRGDIVGLAGVKADTRAFLYREGHMIDLGSPGDDPVSARAIGDNGEIVGMFAVNERIHHAFLWKNGEIADLNTYLPKGSGWTLLQGDGVNARGQIVCQARSAQGEIHAVLLTPVQ